MSYLHGAALVKAARQHKGRREYSSMCQAFCVIVARIGAKGDYDGDGAADAVDGWKKAKARGGVVEARHIANLNTIPAGTIAYWSGGSHGYGHAAITSGGGNIVSTDAPTWGQIGEVHIDWIARYWGNGLRFLGYITNDGDGHQMVDGKHLATPTPKEDADMPTPLKKLYRINKPLRAGQWDYVPLNRKGDVTIAFGNDVRHFTGKIGLRVSGLKPGAALKVQAVRSTKKGSVTTSVESLGTDEPKGTTGDTFIQYLATGSLDATHNSRLRLKVSAPHDGVSIKYVWPNLMTWK